MTDGGAPPNVAGPGKTFPPSPPLDRPAFYSDGSEDFKSGTNPGHCEIQDRTQK